MQEPEEKAPRRRGISPEMIVAVSAVIVSLCALVVSMYEANSVRAQQKTSVWPYVDFDVSYSGQGLRLGFTNKGIGPALIRGFEVTVDGQPVTSLEAMITALVGPDSGIGYDVYKTARFNGEVMPAGQTVRLFEVDSGWTPELRAFADTLGRVRVRYCYCSVYGDCWWADSEGRRIAETCPIPGDHQFSD